METHKKGELTEALVLGELLRRDIPVTTTFGDNQRFDLVVQTPNGRFLSLQVKTGWMTNGTVQFHAKSQHTNSTGNVYKDYEGEIDYFLVYVYELEEMFLVGESEFKNAIRLRVSEPEQKDPSINWADDYEFDERWPPEPPDKPWLPNDRSPAVRTTATTLEEQGIPYVHKPDEPYDFRAVDSAGNDYYLAVGTGRITDGAVQYRIEDPGSHTVDAYCIYDPEHDETYLVPDDAFNTHITLRFAEPTRPDPRINWAADYRFVEQWPPAT